MSTDKEWKPLLIAGYVLVANGVVLLGLGAALAAFAYAGVGLGCLGAGLALLAVGVSRKRRMASGPFGKFGDKGAQPECSDQGEKVKE